jgi:peptidoglycan/LPS O-acetylase OafA/YrhL
MDAVSPHWVIGPLLIAWLTTMALSRVMAAPAETGRYASIDGLRGYLALGVFMHHSAIWYFYLRHGRWEVPPSALYTHLGQSSVALFFMITAFLFWSRLLETRQQGLDWGRLYLSRALRLAPLYLFATVCMGLAVIVLSHGERREGWGPLFRQTLTWIFFAVKGQPNINGEKETGLITAGVTWSLGWEWLLYAALPLMSWLLGHRPPRRWLIASLLGIATLQVGRHIAWHLLSFVGGMLAAWLVRQPLVRTWAAHPAASIVALACIGLTVMGYPSPYALTPLACLSMAFTLIAAGSSIFGLLRWPISRLMGEWAYSVYLLHGLLLFTAFQWGVGRDFAARLSPAGHWGLISALTPLLLVACSLTFRFIERPAMRQTDKWLAQWRGQHP